MSSKFNFFERVRIISNDTKFFGSYGIVQGKGQDDSNRWSYSVRLREDGSNMSFWECELESTGEFITRSEFYLNYPEDTIKVVAVPNQKGDLVGMLKEDYDKLKKK